MIAHAASPTAAAEGFLTKLENAILFPLMILMVSVAILIFLWGAFEFVRDADNDQSRTAGKTHMLYGIIGLLVMLSAYAILKIVAATFGVAA